MEVITMDEYEYHQLGHLSASRLKDMAESPKYMKGNNFKGTPATRIGSAVHMLLMEPERVKDDIIVVPVKGATSKEYVKTVTENPSKLVLTKTEDYSAHEIARGANQNSKIQRIFSAGKAEQTFIGEFCGVPCKARMDWINETTIYDVKTIAKAKNLASTIVDSGYHIQNSWYRAMAKLAGMDIHEFKFVFVFKSFPFDVAVVTLSDELQEYGDKEVVRLVELYKRCEEFGDWPGKYDDKDEIIIELPKWIK
jgi:hypothetical protein